MQEPVEYQLAQRRVFGLAPTGLLAALAAVTLAGAVLVLATGPLAAGLLLLAAAVLLAGLWLEQTGRKRGRLRDLAGLASGALGAWASAGPELARIRLEAARITKERARALYELEHGDDSASPRLEALAARMDELVERANAVLARSRSRLADERLAVARTTIVPPDEMGDPGFEPGTSALSERRSNQLS